MDYKKAYRDLFNEITKAIELLQQAQQKTEDQFIETEENLVLLQNQKDDED